MICACDPEKNFMCYYHVGLYEGQRLAREYKVRERAIEAANKAADALDEARKLARAQLKEIDREFGTSLHEKFAHLLYTGNHRDVFEQTKFNLSAEERKRIEAIERLFPD